MADDFRQRLAATLAATCKLHEINGGCIACDRRLAAIMAVHDGELERLQAEVAEKAAEVDDKSDVGHAVADAWMQRAVESEAEVERLRALIDAQRIQDAPRTVAAWNHYAKHWRERAEKVEAEPARLKVEGAAPPEFRRLDVAEEIVLELRAAGLEARDHVPQQASEVVRQRQGITGDTLLWAATRVEERYVKGRGVRDA